MVETVILVDRKDKEVGFEEKIKAHENGGKLHRAFSVFIFNSKGEMLLQLRSVKKHHFGGLWTNSCCSHPRKGEEIEDAAHRKLKHELGFDTKLKEIFSFIYRRTDANTGLTEYEYDHVFVGEYDGEVSPNFDEIDDFRWVSTDEIQKDAKKNPEKYTPWFDMAIDNVVKFS